MISLKEKIDRTIFLDLPVSEKILTTANLADATQRFRKLKARSNNTIHIRLDNIGGNYSDALKFARYIERSQVRTECVARGKVNSASVLIYLACTHRSIAEDCVIYIHSVDHTFPVTQILRGGRLPTKAYRKARRSQKALEDFLQRRTGGKLPKEIIREIMQQKEARFTAEAALESGIAHEIIRRTGKQQGTP